MKFKLNLSERFEFLNLLPKLENYSTLRIVRKVSKDIGITDDEYKEFDIKQEEGKVTWDPKKAEKEKDFEIGEVATQLIINALKKLDSDKKLEQIHFSLFEKFVENQSPEEKEQ